MTGLNVSTGSNSSFSLLNCTPVLNSSQSHLTSQCGGTHICNPGLVLPVWPPEHAEELETIEKVYRAIIYILGLGYILFGINILTDRMVSCIEVICAQKRKSHVKMQNGKIVVVKIPVWHPVVAGLTIVIAGCSAAELFLPTIEMVKLNYTATEMGPALIFGSGAQHLFFITAVCLFGVKEMESKPIEDLQVFFVTSVFAVWAYLWVYLVLETITPKEITLWEALVTIAMFPVLVLTSWMVEKRYHLKLLVLLQRYTGDVSPNDQQYGDDFATVNSGGMLVSEKRKRLADILRELKVAHPEKTEMELEEMAELRLLESVPKGAGFYRMQASKAISGGGNVISKEKIKRRLEHEQKQEFVDISETVNPNAQVVGFEESHYKFMESCVLAVVTVSRYGAGIYDTILKVDYETVEMTAVPGDDYESTSGTLEFQPGTTSADIVITIIDDDEFEEDKDFKVVLKNLVMTYKKHEIKPMAFDEMFARQNSELKRKAEEVVFSNSETLVTILDDDHCGVFHFESADLAIPDNIGTAKIKVIRSTGARGKVQLPFKVTNGTARAGDDFELPKNHEIIFENDQPEAFISITIIDLDRIGEIYTFSIELGTPVILTKPPDNPLGNPVLGELARVKIGICEDDELADALDRLLRVGDIADLISSTTWLDQFSEAVALPVISTYSESDYDIENSEASRVKSSPTKCRIKCTYFRVYILYVLSLPWKLIAALVPPSGWLDGWVAFIILLGLMAILSALVSDIAAAFGCTVGLSDTVTAITLISFGMGLPDMLASRRAAIQEKTADAAIGGVMGSNAVSVFLGIGLSWTVAAVYHTSKGGSFKLPLSNLSFMVVIYSGLAVLAIFVLLLRRIKPIGGELGGPRSIRMISGMLFIIFWLVFVTLISMQSYCVVSGDIL